MNVLEAINTIEQHAQENTADIRTIKKHKIGEVVRQGDVYIHMVKDDHNVGKELPIRQIADGISIGQRHILKGHVKVYECSVLPSYMHNDFSGMVSYAFDVYGDGAILTHPEHADVHFLEKGRCVVTYQMDMQTRKRVQD